VISLDDHFRRICANELTSSGFYLLSPLGKFGKTIT
jgi:hypothetical protein